MDTQPLFFLSVLLGFVCWGLAGKWYLWPWLSVTPFERAVMPLLLFHSFRYIGLAFVIPGVVDPDLSPGFANPAAYGDLLAAALALLALAALRFRWGVLIPLLWLFNVVGSLDLLNAFAQAFRHRVTADQLGATYFIPTFVVPALFVTHAALFWLLLRHATPGAKKLGG